MSKDISQPRKKNTLSQVISFNEHGWFSFALFFSSSRYARAKNNLWFHHVQHNERQTWKQDTWCWCARWRNKWKEQLIYHTRVLCISFEFTAAIQPEVAVVIVVVVFRTETRPLHFAFRTSFKQQYSIVLNIKQSETSNFFFFECTSQHRIRHAQDATFA